MSLWDDLVGNTAANASNAAAADTFRKQQAASGELKQFGDQYAGQYAGLAGKYDPIVNAGGSALQRLMSGYGLGGGDQGEFTAAYRNLPGYQAALETGTNAAMRQANAAGMGNSGRALMAAQRWGQNFEDQRSGDYLNRLMGLTGMGQQGIGAQIGTVGQGLQGQLGARQSAFGGDMTAAGTIGQGQVAGAQAQQQGLTNLMNTAAYLGGAALSGGTSALGGMPKMQLPGQGPYPKLWG
jgi:hypothetical protein